MCLPSLTSAAKAILAIPSHGAENIPWQRLRGPGFWETQFDGIIEAHDGLAGYRGLVRVPADWTGEALTFDLGQIDFCDEAFFNGSKIMQHVHLNLSWALEGEWSG